MTQMTETMRPEQYFSDPADVLDWLKHLPLQGGAGVMGDPTDCTLHRYAVSRHGAPEGIAVGLLTYVVDGHDYPLPAWARRFVWAHDLLGQVGKEVPVLAAYTLLNEVVRQLAREAQVAAEMEKAWHGKSPLAAFYAPMGVSPLILEVSSGQSLPDSSEVWVLA